MSTETRATLYAGDCREVLAARPERSVDAVVTDPPYGLAFMSQAWDRAVPGSDYWRAVLRVAKPGAHLVAFGGTRTFHRLAVAIEDAGWEIRDCLSWLFGQGFPKSRDVSKAVDALDATEARLARSRLFQTWMREAGLTPAQVDAATGTKMGAHLTTHPTQPFVATPEMFDRLRPLLPPVPTWVEALVRERAVESANLAAREVVGTRSVRTNAGFAGERYGSSETVAYAETRPATEVAARFEGWGTALKPGWEPILLARRPLEGSLGANAGAHGTGGLNIDATRIPCEGGSPAEDRRAISRRTGTVPTSPGTYDRPLQDRSSRERYVEARPGEAIGRWPANVVLDEAAARALDAQTGDLTSGLMRAGTRRVAFLGEGGYGGGFPNVASGRDTYGDTGGASRFFYCPKASAEDRGEADLAALPLFGEPASREENKHPTVKPTALMRWLVRLVTPKDGLVCDPFAGSGSTGVAALAEGFRFVGVELDPRWCEVAARRLKCGPPVVRR